MTISGWFLVLLSALLVVIANLLMRVGLNLAGGFPGRIATLGHDLFLLLKQPLFDIGFISYGLASIVWFKVLSSEPLSIAYPVLVSTTFSLVTLGAVIFFKESFNLYKFGGILLIILGIFVVSGEPKIQ